VGGGGSGVLLGMVGSGWVWRCTSGWDEVTLAILGLRSKASF
jgi:hypothetical protein